MNWWQLILFIIAVTVCVGCLVVVTAAVAYALEEIRKGKR